MNYSGPDAPVLSAQPDQALQTGGLSQCWARIGIYGDSTCAELKHHVHCRNCPVYARAGSTLLDRPLPSGYRAAWSEYFSKSKPLRDLSSSSAVPFRIGSEWLAFPTGCFQEITERRAIHSIPNTSAIVLGIANVRGELLMCISLGHALGFPNLPPINLLRSDYARLLVVSQNGERLAFPVDEVHGPERFFPEQVKPPPALLSRRTGSFSESVIQWQQRSLLLLDPDLVLSAVNRILS